MKEEEILDMSILMSALFHKIDCENYLAYKSLRTDRG